MLEVHVLASGSDGNCIIVKFDDDTIMIDAGLSCRKILGLMEQEGVDSGDVSSILITHEHSDHVSGAGPTARKLGIPIYCNRPTFDNFKAGNVQYNEFKTTNPFSIGNMKIIPLPTSHNAVDPNAFLIEAENTKVLIATDTGKLTFSIEKALEEASLAVIESNYDKGMLTNGPYPPYLKKLIGSDKGHLSNIDCATALKKTTNGDRQIFLAHLSKTNNTPDIARETVSEITGIKRMKIDCLEFIGDTRTLTVREK